MVVVTVCSSLRVVLGAHSGNAMWVVRVNTSSKALLSPIPSYSIHLYFFFLSCRSSDIFLSRRNI